MDQTRVLNSQHARDTTDFYGPKYTRMNFVWEVRSQKQT